jgi:catechol 2,3-dioxygenase-like lactoylglutathione lyase family enzyme
MARLEHANLHVRDVDEMIRFLTAAFPDFRVRGGGEGGIGGLGRRWVHIGNAAAYLALSDATKEPLERWEPYGGRPGVNHLGFEVDDVDGLRARMLEAGYRESTVPNNHPHRRRVYFYDAEGNDWEFVQYRSDDPSERNDYALPDVS